MYCLFECFSSDSSECFIYFHFLKDNYLVYTVYFITKLIVEVSSLAVHVSILFFHRYKILAKGMATQYKDYVSQTSLQAGMAMWLFQAKGREQKQ